MPDDPTPPPPVMLPLDEIAALLAVPARWSILRELARGEALPVSELARRAGITPNLASKHLATMREAGFVEQIYARLYRLSGAVRVDTAAGLLDLGHCLIRLDTTGLR